MCLSWVACFSVEEHTRCTHQIVFQVFIAMAKFFVCQSSSCRGLQSDKLVQDLEDSLFLLNDKDEGAVRTLRMPGSILRMS